MSKTCLICNCENSIRLDPTKLQKALAAAGLEAETGNLSFSNLCRREISHFEKSLTDVGESDEMLVACTQEAPLFSEIAEEAGKGDALTFFNIREAAGWTSDPKDMEAKIAALVVAAQFPQKPALLKALESDGSCVVYGSGQLAHDVAALLDEHLSITLILSDGQSFDLSHQRRFPVYRGDIVSLSGHMGAFSLSLNALAPLRVSSKAEPDFARPRDGVTLQCGLILDLTGDTPMLSGHRHRDGYIRAEPGDQAQVYKRALEMISMVGEFEKPIYVNYDASLCAHSRSGISGCNQCLDVCPAGAIAHSGEQVAFDHAICGGCGSCHAVCPGGAVSYQYPDREDLLGRAAATLRAFKAAGGSNPVLLLHDEATGFETISALARHGDGLPGNVIAMGLHSVTAIGHLELLALIALGAGGVMVLSSPQNAHEFEAVSAEHELARCLLEGLQLDQPNQLIFFADNDPEALQGFLADISTCKPVCRGNFSTRGSKREIARLVFACLHEASPKKPEKIALPAGAPYGQIAIDSEACTLCLSCVSACPASALLDTPDQPRLRFVEAACLQCGLCVNTCPEKALGLVPQLDFTPAAMQPLTLYEEEPFECISCGKPFGTRSTIERIREQLAGKHHMFADPERQKLIEMCEDCRVIAQANSAGDPFSHGQRPKIRRTEDYIEEEKSMLRPEDFLKD